MEKTVKMQLRIIEEITDELIQEIIDRIVQAVDPEKIIIFGSYAYGLPHKHSDLDILVIKESNLPRYERSIPVNEALCDLIMPMDVIVYTPDEMDEWQNVPEAFITSIVKNGKVVYEKQN
ncbi:MAG: nucleotidyltransferase domain-containing protein [bacterium]